MAEIIIIGAGGHSKVVQDVIQTSIDHKVIAVLDDAIGDRYKRDEVVYSNFSYLNEINKNAYKYHIAIGNNQVRKEIFNRLNIPVDKFITLVHSTAIISETVDLGFGSVVMPSVVINADSEIGNHCIINTGSIIEHDCSVGSYAHISPNATLTGNVKVGAGTHVGSSATIIPGKHIGQWSIIGAGSVVINNIEDKKKAVGVPAKLIY